MTLQTFFITLIQFINGVIIPFLIGVAFLLLLVNVIRFFIIGGSNADSQEKARSLALYSLLAFVFLLVFWGIVNLLASSFGLDGCRIPMSDYQKIDFIGPHLPDCPS